jgi:hypothetical protein
VTLRPPAEKVQPSFSNASKTGPLPVAAYSVLLMTISEGKCHSEGEMAELLGRAGFSEFRSFPTAADRGAITARVPGWGTAILGLATPRDGGFMAPWNS